MQAGPPPTRRVLVVDDDSDSADLCRRLLQKTFDTEVLASAEEALSRLENETFTVVVADQTLPKLDGISLLSQCLTRWPNTGRVLMTGRLDANVLSEAINHAKIASFVSKPWQPDNFLSVVCQEVEIAGLRRMADDEHKRYRALVFDAQLDLPTRELLLDEAAGWLSDRGYLGMLIIDCSGVLQPRADSVEYNPVAMMQQILRELRGALRETDLLGVDEVGGMRFCVFLSQPRPERLTCITDVSAIAQRVQSRVVRGLLRQVSKNGFDLPIALGHSFVIHNAQLSRRFQLRRALGRAGDVARVALQDNPSRNQLPVLQRLIVERQTNTVFQPVVEMATGELRGYEALSRGPDDGDLHDPLALLDLAEHFGMSIELDRVMLHNALQSAARIPTTVPVFVNILPATLFDPILDASNAPKLLESLGLDPTRLVLELSERCVMSNGDIVKRNLQSLREVGVRLAIDDVGIGYSGLDRIVALGPDFLKIDRVLVQDIDQRPVQRAVLSAMSKMARDIGVEVIAEGIENERERRCLQDLGFSLGQGFLFSRPAPFNDAI